MLNFATAPPSFKYPVSQACTQAQMQNETYAAWCEKIRETPCLHRKQWEFCYILQCLAEAGVIAPGKRGVGYGVGKEPLPAFLAANGCDIVATDLDTQTAVEKGWTASNEHAANKAAMNERGICDPGTFDKLVTFRVVDMNHIPADFTGFDFTWSACALEHLGSIELGLKFIENTINTLRPGGIAVHTTEFNCSSDKVTLEDPATVIFRKRDIIQVCRRLSKKGCDIVLNFNTGDLPADNFVDVPPYTADPHLKLRLAGYVTTSFGIVIRKPEAGAPRGGLFAALKAKFRP